MSFEIKCIAVDHDNEEEYLTYDSTSNSLFDLLIYHSKYAGSELYGGDVFKGQLVGGASPDTYVDNMMMFLLEEASATGDMEIRWSSSFV